MAFSRSNVGRIVIGVVALAAAVMVGRVSMANVVARSNPSLALSLDADQPDALAQDAYAALSPNPMNAGIRQAIAESHAALRVEPTNAPAAAYLALAMELSGARGKSVGLMAYSERLSRRNLATQLWFVEYEVARGNVAGALKHYDTALRMSPAAPTILFPTLVSATGDEAILPQLARLLAQRPIWAEQYVQQLVQSGTSLGNVSRLLTLLNKKGSPVADRALATFIDRLVGAGQLDEAWTLYTSYRPTARRNQIRNDDFATTIGSPTAFDWTFPDRDAASADIREGALHFDASPASGGPVARQLLELSPGDHVIEAEVADVPALGENAPYLTLQCIAGGSEIARMPIAASGERATRLTWNITVPARCAVQALTLTMQPVDTPGGLSGRFDRLAVIR